MNNKISFLLSNFRLIAGLAVLMLAIPLTGSAQEVTSDIRGTITGIASIRTARARNITHRRIAGPSSI